MFMAGQNTTHIGFLALFTCSIQNNIYLHFVLCFVLFVMNKRKNVKSWVQRIMAWSLKSLFALGLFGIGSASGLNTG